MAEIRKATSREGRKIPGSGAGHTPPRPRELPKMVETAYELLGRDNGLFGKALPHLARTGQIPPHLLKEAERRYGTLTAFSVLGDIPPIARSGLKQIGGEPYELMVWKSLWRGGSSPSLTSLAKGTRAAVKYGYPPPSKAARRFKTLLRKLKVNNEIRRLLPAEERNVEPDLRYVISKPYAVIEQKPYEVGGVGRITPQKLDILLSKTIGRTAERSEGKSLSDIQTVGLLYTTFREVCEQMKIDEEQRKNIWKQVIVNTALNVSGQPRGMALYSPDSIYAKISIRGGFQLPDLATVIHEYAHQGLNRVLIRWLKARGTEGEEISKYLKASSWKKELFAETVTAAAMRNMLYDISYIPQLEKEFRKEFEEMHGIKPEREAFWDRMKEESPLTLAIWHMVPDKIRSGTYVKNYLKRHYESIEPTKYEDQKRAVNLLREVGVIYAMGTHPRADKKFSDIYSLVRKIIFTEEITTYNEALNVVEGYKKGRYKGALKAINKIVKEKKEDMKENKEETSYVPDASGFFRMLKEKKERE
jgi:hypothetical protein